MKFISMLSSSDLAIIRDDSVLRYVAKYSRNLPLRRKAVAELVKMKKSDVLEYIALTCTFQETRVQSIRGLSRLSDLNALKRLVESGDETVIKEACSALVRNMEKAINRCDADALELISRFSKSKRKRKEASEWVKKIRLIRRIRSLERDDHSSIYPPA